MPGKNPIKNIIFLTVDSLRYDRMGSSGYPMRHTPSIDFFARNGINCRNAFTHACGTQFAFPSIFTSTLPLDRGGYDRGIKDRDATFVEALRDNGFNTVGFATGHWLGRFFNYQRGFNHFHQVFGISNFWKNISTIYIAHLKDLRDKGKLTDRECLDRTAVLLREAIEYALTYHEENRKQPCLFGRDVDMHSYDYQKVTDLLKSELEYIRNNKYSFQRIDYFYGRLISLDCVYGGWFNIKPELIDRKNLSKKIISGLRSYNVLKKNLYKTPSAEYLRKAVCGWIDKNSGSPFFLWAHFMDIHCRNFSTDPFYLTPLRKIFLERVRAGRGYSGEEVYDASCKYVDDQIGQMTNFLKQKGLLDTTLIVIASDHGRAAGVPARGKHGIALFYEEFVKIPLIFYNPGLPGMDVDGLSGTIDIAPTILEMMGIRSHPSFKGMSVLSSGIDKRPYLILEHTYKGACDMENKPVYLAVRTERYKYIWREYISGKDSYAKGVTELYDLEKDSFEFTNVVNDDGFRTVGDSMSKIAAERFEEIRSGRKVAR